MCAVSMVGDHYIDKWTRPQAPWSWPRGGDGVPQEDFDKLKREVEELKALLKRAKAYDEKNGEPACETDTKMDILRKVADVVGIDLSGVLDAPKKPRTSRTKPTRSKA